MILLIHLYFVLFCFSQKHIFSYFIYLPTYVLTYLHMKEVIWIHRGLFTYDAFIFLK